LNPPLVKTPFSGHRKRPYAANWRWYSTGVSFLKFSLRLIVVVKIK